ncbi:E7 protein [Human papillomavirus type 1a]|uniref:Protein E7 n=1 Tax=Human papillomavirus type 1 TaxID=10583 RepID=VE7_HPV1|nr:E7 protein [Mupapillomavirus 1]P06465.1 RecName: Full=Protein E7 [Human papillomavirus type 1a]PZQ24052.1 MAG: hypothetical protein DI558_10325 [Corynebacterium propinquum]CAA24316.1 E7 protein [Human papillomavirus type 1a]
MVGEMPALKDLVLQLEPSVLDLDLYCYEEVPPDDIEEELVSPQQPYAVVASCAYCEKLVRLTVLADHSAIRQLEELLLRSLNIVCPLCTLQRQ